MFIKWNVFSVKEYFMGTSLLLFSGVKTSFFVCVIRALHTACSDWLVTHEINVVVGHDKHFIFNEIKYKKKIFKVLAFVSGGRTGCFGKLLWSCVYPKLSYKVTITQAVRIHKEKTVHRVTVLFYFPKGGEGLGVAICTSTSTEGLGLWVFIG